jgi:hypothetical protein
VLIEQPGVLSVAQVGNTLRVLTQADGDAADALARRWRCAVQADVEPIAPEPRGRVRRATRGRDDAQESAHELAPPARSCVKELRQMRRDRITLAMIVGIPVMQLMLFGYASTSTCAACRPASPTRPTPRARARW